MPTESNLHTTASLETRETASLIGGDKVEGTAVYRSNGDKIGQIQRVMTAPERGPRSGTWGQYCASAVGRDAGSFNDAGNAVDIGSEFEITVEEMIELLNDRVPWSPS